MKFMDVVQNGVLQAYGLAPRWKRGRLTTPAQAERLLEYKGERVGRFIREAYAQGKPLQFIECGR